MKIVNKVAGSGFISMVATVDDYAQAKARVFFGKGVQVLNRQDNWSMSMALQGHTEPHPLAISRKEQDSDTAIHAGL